MALIGKAAAATAQSQTEVWARQGGESEKAFYEPVERVTNRGTVTVSGSKLSMHAVKSYFSRTLRPNSMIEDNRS